MRSFTIYELNSTVINDNDGACLIIYNQINFVNPDKKELTYIFMKNYIHPTDLFVKIKDIPSISEDIFENFLELFKKEISDISSIALKENFNISQKDFSFDLENDLKNKKNFSLILKFFFEICLKKDKIFLRFMNNFLMKKIYLDAIRLSLFLITLKYGVMHEEKEQIEMVFVNDEISNKKNLVNNQVISNKNFWLTLKNKNMLNMKKDIFEIVLIKNEYNNCGFSSYAEIGNEGFILLLPCCQFKVGNTSFNEEKNVKTTRLIQMNTFSNWAQNFYICQRPNLFEKLNKIWMNTQSKPLINLIILEEIYSEIVKFEEKFKGKILHLIGENYCTMGEYKKALENFEKAVNENINCFGEEHPSLLYTYNNMGNLYKQINKADLALEYFKKALFIAEKNYGEKNKYSAMVLNNIAINLTEQNKLEDAKRIFQKALVIYESLFGEENPITTNCLRNLSNIYKLEGNNERSLEIRKMCLENDKKSGGDNNASVALDYFLIGLSYFDLNILEESFKNLHLSFEIYKKVYGEQHPQIAANYIQISNLYNSLGNFEEAIDLADKGLDIYRSYYGEEHNMVSEALVKLGDIYQNYQKYTEAKEHYEEAFIILKNEGKEKMKMVNIFCKLGITNQSLGELNKSFEYFQKATNFIEKYLGDSNSLLLSPYQGLATTSLLLRDFENSLKYYNLALDIIVKNYGEDDIYLANVFNGMAVVYKEQEEYELAIEYIDKAIVLEKNYLGEKHPNLAKLFINLGDAYFKNGEYELAVDYVNKAIEIREVLFGKDNVATENLRKFKKMIEEASTSWLA